jgi:hypothetical protein
VLFRLPVSALLILLVACGYEARVAELPLEPDTSAGGSPSTPATPGTQTPGTQTPGTQTPGTQTPGTQTPAVGSPGQITCDSSLDCEFSQFCKDRGDGVKLCMGDGAPGAYCVSSLDCTTGFCKPRGDGFEVCMGKGPPGAACQSSLDCAEGFCRDTGGLVKTCE